MSRATLYNKIWDLHKVTTLPNGQDQLFIGLHFIHEVTTPQAFAHLKERNATVAFPDRTVATIDHIVPTKSIARPFTDSQAEIMIQSLEENIQAHKIKYFGLSSGKQGIVHVIGPELGITQPGMTIACGDSHTSTHGAFGSLAFGIGTTEVEHVLETQTLSLSPMKVRRIWVDGALKKGVTPKDVILKIIQVLGVQGGIGYAYEFAGPVFDAMSMEGRLTVCNMSIEGGARIGYVNPDATTFAYLEGREYSPKGPDWDKAKAYWQSIASDSDAVYDDEIHINGSEIEPMVTWGINPGQSVGVSESLPQPDKAVDEDAYDHMQLKPGIKATDIPVQVAFVGSCTNSRISDLQEAAAVLQNKKIHPNVRMIVVPGSEQVKAEAEKLGLNTIFTNAGAEWRNAGCSMCLAMNPDKLHGDEICASSSNRNFIGRQGSAKGRTLLMSPAMVAAAAISGHVADVREMV